MVIDSQIEISIEKMIEGWLVRCNWPNRTFYSRPKFFKRRKELDKYLNELGDEVKRQILTVPNWNDVHSAQTHAKNTSIVRLTSIGETEDK